jgi:ABC-2 type transport system permease protein
MTATPGVANIRAADTGPLMRSLAFARRSYLLELSKAIEYRGSLFGWAILGGAPLAVSYILYSAIFAARGQQTLGGYDFPTLITYQVISHMLFTISTGWSLLATVSEEIRNGEMNRYLIRPVPYGAYRAIAFCGYNTVFITVLTVPAAVVIFLLRDTLLFTGWGNIALAIAAAAIGYWIQFLIVYCWALSAFWWDEVSGVFFIYVQASKFVSGEMIPVDFLPAPVLGFLTWLPFTNIVWFPVQIYLGRLDDAAIVHGFIVGIVWVILLMLLARYLWKRGVLKYCAYGG